MWEMRQGGQIMPLRSVTSTKRHPSETWAQLGEVTVYLLVLRWERLEHVEIPREGSSGEREAAETREGKDKSSSWEGESEKRQSTDGAMALLQEEERHLFSRNKQKGREIRSRCRKVPTLDSRKLREFRSDGS